jgi:hypothetical protein
MESAVHRHRMTAERDEGCVTYNLEFVIEKQYIIIYMTNQKARVAVTSLNQTTCHVMSLK